MTTVEAFTIAAASERTGVSVDTLRYYEKAGLMPRVTRDAGGQRAYSGHDIEWIVFVRRLRATGMSIQAIARYTELVRLGDAAIGERKAMIDQHRATVAAAIDELVEVRDVLDRKLAHYEAAERGEDLDCRELPLIHVPKLS